MKVLVALKHTIDHNVKPNINTAGQVDLAQVKKAINPFDEISLEEAVRMKERGQVSEILAVAIGGPEAKDSLRHAYALGADRALLVETTDTQLQPLAVAKLLKALVEREKPQLIFLGKQAVGEDYGQTGQMLAALLKVGIGTFASGLSLGSDSIEVTREIEKGTQTLRLTLPAVITSDLRLNEPRFIKLPNLMMAKKKPIDTISASDLSTDVGPGFTVVSVSEPAQKPGAIQLANVRELVEKLHQAEVLQ